MKFELFDDMGVMVIGTREQSVEALIEWFNSSESKELYLRSERLEFISNTRSLSTEDFDILHVAGFTIRKKI